MDKISVLEHLNIAKHAQHKLTDTMYCQSLHAARRQCAQQELMYH